MSIIVLRVATAASGTPASILGGGRIIRQWSASVGAFVNVISYRPTRSISGEYDPINGQ